MTDLYQMVEESVRFLRDLAEPRPDAAIILGTGLGGFADCIEVEGRVPYERIPHFPKSTVEGHKGDLIFGKLSGRNVVVMQGRPHYYEGYSLQRTTLPVRVFRALGAEILSINSAAGGLNPTFRTTDVMLMTDHLNLMGENPLRGPYDYRLGERFPDMTRAYDPKLLRLASQAAVELKIPVRHGVYAAVSGPSLETPAETRMLRAFGADAVGMSTASEVIVAAAVGFRTLGMAVITNVNLPDAMEPISVEQVIENAVMTAPKLGAVMGEVLKGL
jgi:purine-nucleoside phosphorylase